MPKIYAPNRAYSGTGAGGTVFKDGVAETSHPAALQYFRDAGYGIDGPPPNPPEAGSSDARDFAEPIQLGTKLRDAAVDPQPQDFLPPVNAGEADPHGPLVVAPEIHASGPAGIRPGDVHVDDLKAQEAAETQLADRILVAGETHGAANAEVLADHEELPKRPNKSDNKSDWFAYAVARGMSEEEADNRSKADLIEHFDALEAEAAARTAAEDAARAAEAATVAGAEPANPEPSTPEPATEPS